ncbi:MAG: ornithine cyclodeaminase family protein [Proteobacteria bacterium]|nr:ornithine cyclodeaminase family protein [Pseudomonadota bacterium]
MLNLDAKMVAAALPIKQLIEALNEAFASDVEVPARAHHEVSVPGGNAGILLLMPAWRKGANMGVKIVTVFPDNVKQGNPAMFGSYLLMSAKNGMPVALLDGTELTLRRTAAASALASTYLSRKDATKLLMVGTGNLAPHLVRAHATARPIKTVTIWGRRPDAARRLADKLSGSSLEISVADNLEEACRDADIVSCATLATEPLLKGEWLTAGQHIDLVGAFTPGMAEADSLAIARADLYVDTRAGALAESGEIVQAIECGAIIETDIRGSLRDLAMRRAKGRSAVDEITLFKSVGTALEDLAAAELAVRNHNNGS